MAQQRAETSTALTHYLKEIRAYPLLTKQEEHGVGVRLSGLMDAAAAKLVVSNLRFVTKIAIDYSNKGLPFEDLIGEGNLGLIQAALRYDAGRGTKFITYASWWIRKAIRTALTRNSSSVRVPEYRFKRAIAEAGTNRLQILLDPRYRTRSIQDFAEGDDGLRLIDVLAEPGDEGPEERIYRREVLEKLGLVLGSLSSRESLVLRARFGLGGQPTLTLKALGVKLGLTRERVRQIGEEAMSKLKRKLLRELNGRRPLAGIHHAPDRSSA